MSSDDVQAGPGRPGPDFAGAVVAPGNDVVLAHVHRLRVWNGMSAGLAFLQRTKKTDPFTAIRKDWLRF